LAKDVGQGFRKKPNIEFQAAATAAFVKCICSKTEPRNASHPLIVLYPEDKHRKSLMFTSLMPWLFLIVWPMFAVLIHVFQPQGDGM
jgi:hypothetical protein